VVALAAPAPTWALGLGDIELFSALNQPFRAEIALTATADELESLRVSLADRATFDRSGLERPAFMSDLQFSLARNASGAAVVSINSQRSVSEPFVTMIIEAVWSSGVLQREYTVFLDPPVLLNRPQAAAPIAAPQTGGAQQQQSAAPIRREPAPAAAPAQPPRARTPAVTAPAPSGAAREDTYGPIQRAETLWSIAQRYQSAGATMNQTMLAIYDANPAAFGGNMNSLRVGAILRIPPGSELTARSVAAANAEVSRQNDTWRGRSAAAPVSQEPRVVLVPPSADSVTRGSGAAAPGQAGAGADTGAVAALQSEVAALRDQLAERERLMELQSAQLAALQNQLAALSETAALPAEDPVSTTTSPGVDIEPAPGGDEPVFADEPDADPAAAVAEPPQAAAPAEAPAPRAVVAERAPEPTLVERIIDAATGWLGLVVAGIAAILVAALWFMRRREEEVEDVTGQWDALEAGMDEPKIPSSVATSTSVARDRDAVEASFGATDSLFADDHVTPQSTTLPIDDAEEIAADHFARAAGDSVSSDDTMSTSQVMNLDEADPVAEADFHMAYGLYDQAAELLSKELQANPERRDLRLKLLEVYFVWGNKEEFLDAATHLRGQMGDQPDSDWDKVLIMGKQICPEAELFAAASTGGSEVDVSLSDTSAGSLDFPFEDTSDSEAMDLVDIGEATSADLPADDAIDLDLTGNQPSPLTSSSTGLLDATGTLNIGTDTAASLEAALFDETDSHGEGATAPLGPNDETLAAPAGIDPATLAETQESPALHGSAGSDETIESPTVEQFGSDQPTVESPMARDDATVLQATAISTGDDDYAGGTQELPTVSQSSPGGDSTAEIELNDLGLDVAGLDDDFGIDDMGAELDADTGDTREQEALKIEDSGEMLSATGITQVLAEQTAQNTALDDDQTQLQSGGTLLGEADVKQRAGAETELMESPGADEFDLDLNDLEAALSDAETIEQPRSVDAVDLGFTTSSDLTPIDHEIGEELIGSDDPTGTEDVRAADPQTLTEVGTKLDLARAYIDMGDPDGARSILEEVLSEGDATQRDEAQNLIDAIGA
jgi:pilus assembly protein FimV